MVLVRGQVNGICDADHYVSPNMSSKSQLTWLNDLVSPRLQFYEAYLPVRQLPSQYIFVQKFRQTTLHVSIYLIWYTLPPTQMSKSDTNEIQEWTLDHRKWTFLSKSSDRQHYISIYLIWFTLHPTQMSKSDTNEIQIVKFGQYRK